MGNTPVYVLQETKQKTNLISLWVRLDSNPEDYKHLMVMRYLCKAMTESYVDRFAEWVATSPACYKGIFLRLAENPWKGSLVLAGLLTFNAQLRHGFFPPKQRDTTIYKAMFRCRMQGSLFTCPRRMGLDQKAVQHLFVGLTKCETRPEHAIL